MSALIDSVKEHMAKNEVDGALEALDHYLDAMRSQVKFSDYLEECENTTIMLKARYQSLRDHIILGTLSKKDADRELARISHAIIELIKKAHLIENMEELDKQVINAPVLRIEKDFDSFTAEEFKQLNEVLKEVLPDDARVKLLGVKKGSVEVMLEISEADMAKLLIAIKDKKVLELMGISTIEFRSMKNIDKPVTREDNIRLLQEKLEKLNRDRIISSDSEEQFELDQQIKEAEAQLTSLKG